MGAILDAMKARGEAVELRGPDTNNYLRKADLGPRLEKADSGYPGGEDRTVPSASAGGSVEGQFSEEAEEVYLDRDVFSAHVRSLVEGAGGKYDVGKNIRAGNLIAVPTDLLKAVQRLSANADLLNKAIRLSLEREERMRKATGEHRTRPSAPGTGTVSAKERQAGSVSGGAGGSASGSRSGSVSGETGSESGEVSKLDKALIAQLAASSPEALSDAIEKADNPATVAVLRQALRQSLARC